MKSIGRHVVIQNNDDHKYDKLKIMRLIEVSIQAMRRKDES